MSKVKKIIKNPRVIILFLAVIIAYFAINGGFVPHFWDEGIAIRSVAMDSAAERAGIENPTPTSTPTSRERIISINGKEINTVEDYYDIVSDSKINQTLHIKTNEDTYKVTIQENFETIVLNETEIVNVTEEVFDNETNTTINVTREVEQNKTMTESLGAEDLGLRVYEYPKTNIYKGLDLQGGMRVLLKPEEEVSQEDMDLIIENLKTRLNVYGLSDLVIRETNDLSGNQYIMVEIPGAQEEEVTELISQQGKFHAQIGDDIVFRGGDEDIIYVCRSADCSGIDPRVGCSRSGDGYVCSFSFAITMSTEAAKRQAEATENLEVIAGEGGSYLSEKLVLYLDDEPVDELQISSSLKGKAVTDISISGPGAGNTRNAAIENALDNMKKLQTIIITGSLPVKLEVVKADAISPTFGKEFVNSAILMGILAIAAVGCVILVKYRKIKIVLPMIFTSFFEVIMLLGVAAIIRQSIDLAAIAGIIISVGSGVDHLIVITDETLKGSTHMADWKTKIKNAFSIVFVAYFTTCAAMVPLIWAGAGMLKGFAVVTVIGVSIGVLIARPAYAKVIEILVNE